MKRLFGTDGIRAVAGEPPLDPPTVRRFGAALARVLLERSPAACRAHAAAITAVAAVRRSRSSRSSSHAGTWASPARRASIASGCDSASPSWPSRSV